MAEKRERSPERAPDPDFNEDDPALLADTDPPAVETDPPADDRATDPPADDGEDQRKLEARARRMGWVPQAEFRGDPAKWVDAEEFIEIGLGNNRILAERNEKLDREVVELKSKVDESGQVLGALHGQIKALNDRFINADRAGYARGRAEAEARMRAAAAEADVEAFDAAKADLDAYDRAPPPAPEAPRTAAPARPQIDPVTQAWVGESRNEWFKDEELSEAAIVAHKRLIAKNPRYKTPEGQLEGLNAAREEVFKRYRDEIAERYPHLIENPRRAASGSVRSPSGDRGSGARSKKRTVADLPEDARKELARFKRTIPNYKDDEYLAIYFQGE